MTTYLGTQNVKSGLYLNVRQLSFKFVEKPGPLPGATTDVYRSVPMLALLFAAPVLGLMYVIFLPFLGFAMVAGLLGGKVAQLAGQAAGEAVRVLRPGWEPSLAFFSRTKPDAKTVKTPDATPDPDTFVADVEKTLHETDRHA
jgi:hypothetical protein